MSEKQIIDTIRETLEELRPYFHKDGGDVELVNFDEKQRIVYIRWLGNCTQCSMTPMTKAGIEAAIRSKLPEIAGVESVAV